VLPAIRRTISTSHNVCAFPCITFLQVDKFCGRCSMVRIIQCNARWPARGFEAPAFCEQSLHAAELCQYLRLCGSIEDNEEAAYESSAWSSSALFAVVKTASRSHSSAPPWDSGQRVFCMIIRSLNVKSILIHKYRVIFQLRWS
jgi:hypothetical protein